MAERSETPTAPFVTISVPLIPPTVNHYVKHTRTGRHYVTSEAKDFGVTFRIFAAGNQVRGDWYKVDVIIYLGKGDKGDVDNFNKCVLDSLVSAGVIDTDAKVIDLRTRKTRDWENPRTEVTVVAYRKKES